MSKTKSDIERSEQFKKDNAVATRFEKEIFIRAIHFDPNFYFGFKWTTGSHPNYDVLLTNKDDSHNAIEVKAQKIYNDTNDYFSIETQQKNEPSGLSLSKSDYYYIFKIKQADKDTLIDIYYEKNKNQTAENGISYTLYQIKTDHLRQLIMNNNYPISNYSDNKKKGNIKYDIPIKDVNVNKITGSLNSNEIIELDKDNRLIFKRPYLEQKIGKTDGYVLWLDRVYYTKNEYINELYNDPTILNQDNFIYNRINSNDVDYGFGKYVSPSNSDSSSSSEGEETSLKVFNRIKRNINKKYKIKKEKYL
jgi:hypothetical protein